METICFPKQFGRDTLSEFFYKLETNQFTENVTIDCSTLEYTYPTGMLIAGSKIREWLLIRKTHGLVNTVVGHNCSKQVHSYLSHLGFFDFILIEGSKQIGEATGSMTYLPITRLKKPNFDSSTQDVDEWYGDIMSGVRSLAKVVSGTLDDTEENRLYNYAFREIIRNVFEHSGAEECYVCGQRWWNGKVEIAVIDEGCGIADSLRRSHTVSSDISAIKQAIRPGISSTTNICDSENIYDNSGFGLYVLSELASSFGWYTLGSGSARIVGQQSTIKEDDLNFNGTYFGMQLNSSPRQFGSLLTDIIHAGETEAKASGITQKASGISKLF
ncbi:hypothetical protein [Vibrio atlanticus]|uniref:ATP-binding protein n=1 Tax=Vibrio atlanticus TaxID=693153 RepID=A0ABV4KUK9_9VIBR